MALQTLNWAVLPVGAYTGSRLAAWISSNFASATYVESTSEIGVAYDEYSDDVRKLNTDGFIWH